MIVNVNISTTPKEGPDGVFSIHINDDFWRDIHSSIFGRKPKLPSNCLSINEFEEQFHLLEYRLAKQYVLKRLSLKSYPSDELIQKLQDSLISDEVIAKIIQECQQLGYINDLEWIQSFIRQQISRHTGPKMIMIKLKKKGLSNEVLNQAKAIIDEMGDALQKEQISKLLKSKYSKRDLKDFKERQKVIGALFRKGFDVDIIKATILNIK